MTIFYLGVLVEALLALSAALIIQGIRHQLIARTWTLLLERDDLPAFEETSHSAL